MRSHIKRAVLFVPVWICLIILSIIRELLFAKVKSYRRLQQRNKFDNVCKGLYSLVKNPYRFPRPSFFVPGYYLPSYNVRLEQLPIDPEVIAKIQQLRDLPNGECIHLDLSARDSDHSAG